MMPRYNIKEDMYDDGRHYIEDNSSIEFEPHDDGPAVDAFAVFCDEEDNSYNAYLNRCKRMEEHNG